MSDPFIGEIKLVGFNFPPYQWAFCKGQSVSVSQAGALYGIIGNVFGGTNTAFNLPDLQSRVVTGADSAYVLGRKGGAENVTLTYAQAPKHTHVAQTTTTFMPGQQTAAPSQGVSLPIGVATSSSPVVGKKSFSADGVASDTTFANDMIGPAFSTNPTAHENRQPYLALNFIIAMQGIWPYQN